MLNRWDDWQPKSFFEYNPEFISTGLQLSPLKLPLKPGVIPCDESTFGGLFGIFNDSLPDGWGRLLLDRKLMKLGITPDSLIPLDRLCYVGKGGMGALIYEPELEHRSEKHPQIDLDQISAECLLFLENEGDQYVEELLALNGSSAGARPKIMIRLMDESDWIIKFRSFLDPSDIGPIEYAYHRMAAGAGVEVPEARLFPSRTCEGYFGVRRFDREGNKRFHMHTASGLLHADHRFPSLDY